MLGDWQLLKFLGKGATARVYLASSLTNASWQRAIKVFSLQGNNSRDKDELRMRLSLEAEICKDPLNEYVITVTEPPREANGYLFHVMTYADGGSLQDFIQQYKDDEQQIAVEEVCRLGVQICEGLAAIHAHMMELVHRDICPANILINKGNVLISDLGFAQTREDLTNRSKMGSMALSHPGHPAYMSPQQATDSRPVKPCDDIFAVGCVLFELLTLQQYQGGRKTYSPHPKEIRPDVPAWLDAAVAASLAEERKDRIQTAKDLRQSLEKRLFLQSSAARERETADIYDFMELLGKIPSLKVTEQIILEVPTDLPFAAEKAWDETLARFFEPQGQGAYLDWLEDDIIPAFIKARNLPMRDRMKNLLDQVKQVHTQAAGQNDLLVRSQAFTRFLQGFKSFHSPQLELVPNGGLDFGEVGMGISTPAQDLIMKNTGSGRLVVRLTASHPALGVDNNQIFICGPGQSHTSQISLRLDDVLQKGERPNLHLRVESNVGDHELPVSYTVLPPQVSLSTNRLIFDGTGLNELQTLSITNSGRSPLTGTITVKVPWLRLEPSVSEFRCNPGEQVHWKVMLVPDQAKLDGEKAEDAIQLKTNAGDYAISVSVPSSPADLEWVQIPAGEFLYGDKKEKRTIAKAFLIGKYPITNAQYKRFLDANPSYKIPGAGWDRQKRTYPIEKEKHPVVNISWNDAQAFCQWAGCRLPLEEEWEKAARGTDGRTYPWGEDWQSGKYCNSSEANKGSTTRVDAYPAGISPYGVWDMSGNVWEWTASKFDDERYVLRGGASNVIHNSVHSAYRSRGIPAYAYSYYGFRCARGISPEDEVDLQKAFKETEEERDRQIVQLLTTGHKAINQRDWTLADSSVSELSNLGENGRLARAKLWQQIYQAKQQELERLLSVGSDAINKQDWQAANGLLTELSKLGEKGRSAATTLKQQIDEAHWAWATDRVRQLNEAIKVNISQAQPNLWREIKGKAILVFGPENGSLQMNKDGLIKLRGSGPRKLRDSIIYAEFQNTFLATPVPWTCGFEFRSSGIFDQYRLIFRSSGEWALENHIGNQKDHKAIQLQGGKIMNLDANKNGAIKILVICHGESGALYVNDKFVAELLLAARMNLGEVSFASGMYKGYNEGYSTNFSDFTVWELPAPRIPEKLSWWNPVDWFRLLGWSLLTPARINTLDRVDPAGLSLVRRVFAAAFLWFPFVVIILGLKLGTIPIPKFMEDIYILGLPWLTVAQFAVAVGLVLTVQPDSANSGYELRSLLFAVLPWSFAMLSGLLLGTAVPLDLRIAILACTFLFIFTGIVFGVAKQNSPLLTGTALVLGSIIGVLTHLSIIGPIEVLFTNTVFVSIVAIIVNYYQWKIAQKGIGVIVCLLCLTGVFVCSYALAQYRMIFSWSVVGSSLLVSLGAIAAAIALGSLGGWISDRIKSNKHSPWLLGLLAASYIMFTWYILVGGSSLHITPLQPPRPINTSMLTATPTTPMLVTQAPLSSFTALPASETRQSSSTPTESPTLTPIPQLPQVYDPNPLVDDYHDALGVPMRLITAGNFSMGNKNKPNQLPVHEVYLDNYYIDKYEVTNGLYKACVEAGTCQSPMRSSSYTRSSYYGNSDFDNYPVIYVDWNMANSYCEWRGVKLPTEAEWEKVANTDAEQTNSASYAKEDYVWGNMSLIKNSGWQYYSDTTQVGRFADDNTYSVHDMTGNVWEWVNDWYSDTYFKYSPASNPLGPDSGTSHVIRGGTWEYSVENGYYSTSPYRGGGASDSFYPYVGFRCARSAP